MQENLNFWEILTELNVKKTITTFFFWLPIQTIEEKNLHQNQIQKNPQ